MFIFSEKFEMMRFDHFFSLTVQRKISQRFRKRKFQTNYELNFESMALKIKFLPKNRKNNQESIVKFRQLG